MLVFYVLSVQRRTNFGFMFFFLFSLSVMNFCKGPHNRYVCVYFLCSMFKKEYFISCKGWSKMDDDKMDTYITEQFTSSDKIDNVRMVKYIRKLFNNSFLLYSIFYESKSYAECSQQLLFFRRWQSILNITVLNPKNVNKNKWDHVNNSCQ